MNKQLSYYMGVWVGLFISLFITNKISILGFMIFVELVFLLHLVFFGLEENK